MLMEASDNTTVSSDSLSNSSDGISTIALSKSMLQAQEEADKEADELEKSLIEKEKENSLNDSGTVVPTLLVGTTDNITTTTTDSKSQDLSTKAKSLVEGRADQLDLLLLKAESYSHFIAQNQERTMKLIDSSSTSSSMSDLSAASNKKGSKSSKRSTPSKVSNSSKKMKDLLGDGQDDVVLAMAQPKSLTGGTLMPYQLEGVKWLISLWENGLSGILADEMGLGKTIQIIGLIAFLFDQNIDGPFLIIGPLATLPNWYNEFKKWLPSCDVILYHGSKVEREALRKKHMKKGTHGFPVVISSFEICMIDRPQLEQYQWQYVILDEGHRIKNRECRLVKELKKIKSTSRLLLTGTPIQNTLDELWSLLNFVNPHIFDSLDVFQSWFGFRNIGQDTQVDDIMANEQQNRVVSKLHDVLRPFVLRRMKKDVLIKMPPKCEVIVYTGMSALQREYYARVLDDTIRDTLLQMNIDGAKNTSQINQTMNLRKVCNHPFLFGEPRDKSGILLGEANPKFLSMASGKFRLLDRLLPALKQKGHKVLIFSQMTELLNILEDYCMTNKFGYCRLDGSTKMVDRQKSIDSFNEDDDLFIFMLSTRAGGLGINLTAADTCIIFDSDWNPHLDSQAQDRCHRIGQHRPVIVYRLLTAGSVEMEMLAKQISKKKLERMTIHGSDFKKAGERCSSKELTLEKLKLLLEDDIKITNRAGSDEGFKGGHKDKAGTEHISKSELDVIIDRDALFKAIATNQPEKHMQLEGAMYDVVLPKGESSGALGGINN